MGERFSLQAAKLKMKQSVEVATKSWVLWRVSGVLAEQAIVAISYTLPSPVNENQAGCPMGSPPKQSVNSSPKGSEVTLLNGPKVSVSLGEMIKGKAVLQLF